MKPPAVRKLQQPGGENFLRLKIFLKHFSQA